jgi:hypothetical protein
MRERRAGAFELEPGIGEQGVRNALGAILEE